MARVQPVRAVPFRRARRLARVPFSHFPTLFLSFPVGMTGARMRTPAVSAFFSFTALVCCAPCASAPEIFIPAAAAEQPFRRVPPQDRSISLRALSERRFAILSLRVVRSLAYGSS